MKPHPPRPSVDEAPRFARAFPAVVGALFALVATPLLAQQTSISEYGLKAAFVYNFAKFVDWSPDAFPAGDAPILIGIVGQDPFGAILDHIVEGKAVNGRSVEVLRFASPRELRRCHLLFVSRSEDGRLDSILHAEQTGGALTIGETEAFARHGGMIRFVIVDETVRFEIDRDAAEHAGLRLSARLLNVAYAVHHREG